MFGENDNREMTRLQHVECADSLLYLSDLSGEFAGVFTDPPYCSGAAQSAQRQRGNTSAKYGGLPFLGDTRDQAAFKYWCTLWLSHCYRLTVDGGVCAVWIDWRQLSTIADALQAAGFIWRGVVVWDKTLAARPVPGRPRHQCEYLLWGSKGKLKSEGSPLPGCVSASVPNDERFHIAAKPVSVLRPFLSLFRSDLPILDPFAGSGSLAVACVLENQPYLGLEMDEGWSAMANDRIVATAEGSTLGAFKSGQTSLLCVGVDDV